MPLIKPKHVVSFSSEDLKHPAENLLKPETYFKWRSAKGGEPQVSAVLQLEKSSKIQAIDLGNNGSAFIEVLVGRSSWSSNEEFQVLLAASSFMSPSESKANKELNRVRMFGKKHFIKTVVEEKWDVVKTVCTQPYNLKEAYGISFINIHAPPDTEKKPEKSVKLGRFKMKSDSDDDSISTGSFFQRTLSGPISTTVPPSAQSASKTMAAAVRDASISLTPTTVKTKGETTASTTKKISVSGERRNEVAAILMQSDDSDSKQDELRVFPKMKVKAVKEHNKRKIDTGKGCGNTMSRTQPPSKRVKTQDKPKKKEKKNVPFNKILNGVVFVLSGFENPERGKIRDLALSMGAEYVPSWDNRCTHLICAFMNTPKFHQVKGRGKIIKKDWIKECSKNKKRLRTKSFRMDGGGESSKESSSDNDGDDNKTTKPKPSKSTQNAAAADDDDDDDDDDGDDDDDDDKEIVDSEEKEEKIPEETSPVSSDKSTIPTLQKKNSPERTHKSSSECDTEDELEKIREAKRESLPQPKTETNEDDQYGGTTDEDDVKESGPSSEVRTQSVPELSNFFESKNFLIYGEMDSKDRRLLKRYITAYSGSLVDYMSVDVDYVISNEEWDKHFDEAFDENQSLIFLRPIWVTKCHEKQKLVDHTSYQIVKETT